MKKYDKGPIEYDIKTHFRLHTTIHQKTSEKRDEERDCISKIVEKKNDIFDKLQEFLIMSE